MKKIRILVLISIGVLLLAASLLAACAAPAPAPTPAPAPAPAPTPTTVIEWRVAGLTNEAHWLGRAKLWWADELSKQTNGRLKLRFYPGGTLGKTGADVIALVNKGLAEVGDVYDGHISGELPGIDVYNLAGLIPGDMALRRKLNQAMFPDFKKAFESNYNVYFVTLVEADPRNLYTKKKVERLADLKGFKIRGAGPAENSFYDALGAKGTFIGQTELYTALQQGVMDGSGYLDSSLIDFKLYEVVKYKVPLGYDGGAQVVVISKEKFNALPPDIQKIVLDSGPALQEKTQDFIINDYEAAGKKVLELGVQLVNWPQADLDQVTRSLGPLWQDWLTKAGPLGKQLFDKIQAQVKTLSAK